MCQRNMLPKATITPEVRSRKSDFKSEVPVQGRTIAQPLDEIATMEDSVIKYAGSTARVVFVAVPDEYKSGWKVNARRGASLISPSTMTAPSGWSPVSSYSPSWDMATDSLFTIDHESYTDASISSVESEWESATEEYPQEWIAQIRAGMKGSKVSYIGLMNT